MSSSGQHVLEESSQGIVGLQLVNDADAHRRTNLGVLVIPSDIQKGICVSEIRNIIQTQAVACPPNYSVCTNQGWPVMENQEKSIKLQQILTSDNSVLIKVKHEHPKLGIKNKEGAVMGFVHISYNSVLHSARQLINQQVLDANTSSQTFHFLDGNSWPISTQQESHMTVLDILIGSCVSIDMCLKRRSSDDFSPPKLPPDKRLKGTKQLSFRSSKDIFRLPFIEEMSPCSSNKQVLLSYVRLEAADHALHLKEELSALGLSVYLDVHEIKTGVDWQDSLNFAVSGCQVFIPLVTQKYGLTQWTNREVKLADVLGKYILPVNFLLEWPPRCLAIQFASTQFIPWIPQDELIDDQSKLLDLSSEPLNMSHLKRVASKISDRVKSLTLSSRPSLVKRTTIVKSCAMLKEDNSMAITSDREGKPLVVICLHPNEEQHGKELREVLEREGFEVWCTTQLDRKHLDHIDGLESSQEGTCYVMALKNGYFGDEGKRCIQEFQEKADDASMVLCVLSMSFSQSRTCQQQVFYCEHRKKIVHIMYEDFPIPDWMAMLIGSQGFQLRNDEDYLDIIVRRVRTETNPSNRESQSQTPTTPNIDDSLTVSMRSPEARSSSGSSPDTSPIKRPSLSSMQTVILHGTP